SHGMSSGSSTRARAVPPLGSGGGEPYELPCALGVTGHAQIVRSIRALGSIDPRVSLRPERACIHASAGIDPSIPALPSAPRACPSIQVRTWIDRSPRVSPWKCACPSNQDRSSLSSERGSMERSPRIPPCKCAYPSSPRACHSIQVRLSGDRTPPFADRTGSHVPCPTYFSPDRSRRRAIPGETSTRGTVLRGGASSRHDPRNREGSHDSYFRVRFGYPRAARLQANDARGPQRSM